jgi:hypothetical protein
MATMQECIRDCLECHAVCLTTISSCLGRGGEHAEPNHIRLLQDCAEICSISASFMLRGSPYHQLTCRVCAGICEACADSCERLAEGDDRLRRCIELCRRCVASCGEMASAERRAA